MAGKHLREPLVEDQEPFLLEYYISDRCRQLNKPPRPLLLHPKPTSFSQSFLKSANACFSSSSSRYCNPNNSSPLPPRFDAVALRARAKIAGNNTVLLGVLKRMAALLIETALMIENCDPKDGDSPDNKKQGKSGAGVDTGESLFRKFLKFGRRSRKKEFGGSEGDDGVLVRNILRLDNSGDRQNQGKANTNKNTNTSKKKSSYVGNCSYRRQGLHGFDLGILLGKKKGTSLTSRQGLRGVTTASGRFSFAMSSRSRSGFNERHKRIERN